MLSLTSVQMIMPTPPSEDEEEEEEVDGGVDSAGESGTGEEEGA